MELPSEAFTDPMYFLKRVNYHISTWYGPVNVDSPEGRVITEMAAGSTEATTISVQTGRFDPIILAHHIMGMLEAAYNMGRAKAIGSTLNWTMFEPIEPPTIHETVLLPEPPAILPEPGKDDEDMIWTNLDGEPFIDEPPDPTTGPETDDDASGWGESNQESE